jgi:hypothetical protein
MLKEERAYIDTYKPKYNKDSGTDIRTIKGSDNDINVKRF